MDFKVGDKIVVCFSFDDPLEVKERTVLRINRDTVFVEGEGAFDAAACWPLSKKEAIVDICRRRQMKKKELDDIMRDVYKLRNQLIRDGFYSSKSSKNGDSFCA